MRLCLHSFFIESNWLKTVLLGAASQRIEYLALEFIGTPWLLEILEEWRERERGAYPGPTEACIIIYIISISYIINFFLSKCEECNNIMSIMIRLDLG